MNPELMLLSLLDLLDKTTEEVERPLCRSVGGSRRDTEPDYHINTGNGAAFSGACHIPINYADIDQHIDYCQMQRDPDEKNAQDEIMRLNNLGLWRSHCSHRKNIFLDGVLYSFKPKWHPGEKKTYLTLFSRRDTTVPNALRKKSEYEARKRINWSDKT